MRRPGVKTGSENTALSVSLGEAGALSGERKAAGVRRLRPFEDQGKPALQERPSEDVPSRRLSLALYSHSV
jgi:hypothetical protein